MTFTTLATPSVYAGSPKRGPVTRLLEDERWLAMLLLLPTLALLGLFIAYPFIEGVRLSVTDAKVGVPGQFVGLQIRQLLTESLLLAVAGGAAQPPFQGQILHPRLYPAALYHSDRAVDIGVEMDVRPDVQRHQLDAVQARRDSQPDQLAR